MMMPTRGAGDDADAGTGAGGDSGSAATAEFWKPLMDQLLVKVVFIHSQQAQKFGLVLPI